MVYCFVFWMGSAFVDVTVYNHNSTAFTPNLHEWIIGWTIQWSAWISPSDVWTMLIRWLHYLPHLLKPSIWIGLLRGSAHDSSHLWRNKPKFSLAPSSLPLNWLIWGWELSNWERLDHYIRTQDTAATNRPPPILFIGGGRQFTGKLMKQKTCLTKIHAQYCFLKPTK